MKQPKSLSALATANEHLRGRLTRMRRAINDVLRELPRSGRTRNMLEAALRGDDVSLEDGETNEEAK